jgi:hypothetical protein
MEVDQAFTHDQGRNSLFVMKQRATIILAVGVILPGVFTWPDGLNTSVLGHHAFD